MVGIPWLPSKSEDVADWGFACQACKTRKLTDAERDDYGTRRFFHIKRTRLYSKQGFLDHLAECIDAEKLFVKNFKKMFNDKELRLNLFHACQVAGDGNKREKRDILLT